MTAPHRRVSRQIAVGKVLIGGNAPVSVQSMCNTDTRDVEATLKQIRTLAARGCEIIRLAVPDMSAAHALGSIVESSPIPVIADIHFDHRLALAAIENHVAAIRLNPGNLTDADAIRQVAELAVKTNTPIRVGANGGSVRANLLKELRTQLPPDEAMAEALVQSALHECSLLEKFGVTQLKVALKSSSVPVTLAAYRKFADRTDYPLHIGITEAGTFYRGIIKSAVGIGSLLSQGIGDTLRVSLTADPAEEVTAGIRILEAIGLRDASPELVSCPTCGRTEINLIELADRVENLVDSLKSSGKKINLSKIAVMGCAVNGPGEARDADLGIAGSKSGQILVFAKGKVLGAFEEEAGFAFFKDELLKHCGE